MERKSKVPSYFGLQVRPILPTRFIGEPVLEQNNDEFYTTFTQRVGYSFGGVVRVGLTRLISLETGLNYNHRNFDINFSIPDSTVQGKNDLSFITYTLPVNGLVYIPLSEQWFMNASLGASLSYNPTNVGVKSLVDAKKNYHQFTHSGLAHKVIAELNANFGFEFRTEKNGFFYIGGSAVVPTSNLFYLKSVYQYEGYSKEMFDKVDGSYLALDFKYFFPIINNKGAQPIKGPIER